MKKSILIFCTVIAALSLTAFGFLNTDESRLNNTCASDKEAVASTEETRTVNQAAVEFFYDVDTRFIMKATKEELRSLETIEQFLRPHEVEGIQAYDSVSIIVLDDWRQTEKRVTGPDQYLTMEQKDFLNALDYSTNILIQANYTIDVPGIPDKSYSTPHITIVPEQEAEYPGGKEALIEYLKANSVAQTAIAVQGNLKAGKIYFTVNRFGYVSDVNLVSSCGYTNIDFLMSDLISKAPGKWKVAANEKGELVEQTFVYSFGIIGC